VPHGVRDPDDEDAWRGVELELRGALAASYFGRGRYQLAIDTSDAVLKDAEALRMMELVLLVRHRLAELNLALGRYDEVERHVDAMIATARQLGNETGEAVARVVRAKGLRLRDDAAGALAELELASGLVVGGDWYVHQPQLLTIRSACLVSLGRLDEAERLLEEASDAAGASGVPEWTAAVRLVHASLLLARGDADAAADEAADAARTFEAEWAYFEQAQALRLQAQAHLEAGNRGTAAYFFSQSAAVFERIGNAEQSERTLGSAEAATVTA
jgi:ATP/maltotriose-dependent transcriptional regulator MalT